MGERKKGWDQVFRQNCVGLNSALVYIGILVTSTTTGHGGSAVNALTSQDVFFPRVFFSLP